MAARPAPSSPFRSLSPWQLWRHGEPGEQRWLLGGWLVLLLLSVGLGLASVMAGWSGLPLSLGGVQVYVTVYPPLILCLWLSLCWGLSWGAIPAYVATWVLAIYAGMPWGWASAFAFADPLHFAIMVMGYRAIPVRRDLRDGPSLLFYVQLSFVASIFSSSGALIWWYTNDIDRTGLLPIWQGWWLGSFLQSLFVVGPLMALSWPRIEAWQQARPALMSAPPRDPRRAVLRLLTAVSAAVVAYGFITLQLAGTHLGMAQREGAAGLAQALAVVQQSSWVIFSVFSLIVLFMAFFGYQLFVHWQRSMERLLVELQQANRRLETLAHTDALTGLLNRRAADERLLAEWHRTLRTGTGATLVMLDIDHFKQINDRHGHLAGDAVIRTLAQAIREEARDMDIASRYGGEEFLVILPQTGLVGGRGFAERLRRRVEAQPAHHEGATLPFTISLGLSCQTAQDPAYLTALDRADQALYRAKEGGRNRVEALERSELQPDDRSDEAQSLKS